jgi:ribonucleotide reductase alpha subunit
VNQSSRRKGSIAFYIEPWHADIFDVLYTRRTGGNENDKCRDLFFAIFVNDLFMERVLADSLWSLFCPGKIDNIL